MHMNMQWVICRREGREGVKRRAIFFCAPLVLSECLLTIWLHSNPFKECYSVAGLGDTHCGWWSTWSIFEWVISSAPSMRDARCVGREVRPRWFSALMKLQRQTSKTSSGLTVRSCEENHEWRQRIAWCSPLSHLGVGHRSDWKKESSRTHFPYNSSPAETGCFLQPRPGF